MPDQKTPVIFCHDGSIDDFMALMLIATLTNVELLGVVVTDADCYVEPALEASRKILDITGHKQVGLSKSEATPRHTFPMDWRLDSFKINAFPVLNEHNPQPYEDDPRTGSEFIGDLLEQSSEQVTIVEVGPLSTISILLKNRPDLASRIERIVWMGGALYVPGNVSNEIEPIHDGSAEWNVYWDAVSAKHVLDSGIPLVLCPLDLTNTVPVDASFMQELTTNRKFKLSDIAGQCYALKFYQTYTIWDVLTAAFIAWPELFQVSKIKIDIETRGPSEGRTMECQDGTLVDVLTSVDHAQFWSRLVQAFKQNGVANV